VERIPRELDGLLPSDGFTKAVEAVGTGLE
jgi:hypothetical protein